MIEACFIVIGAGVVIGVMMAVAGTRWYWDLPKENIPYEGVREQQLRGNADRYLGRRSDERKVESTRRTS